jgi:hypothetical protein
MRPTRRQLTFLSLAAFLPTLSGSASAQTTQALISGRITNELSGVPVASSTLTCTGAATNTVIGTTTDRDGFYTVPMLPPGQYELEVNAPGFQAKAQFEIPLGVASSLELDFALRPLVNIQEPILPRAVLIPGGKSLLNFYGPDVDPNFWTTYAANTGAPGKLEASISDAVQPPDIQQLPLEGNNIYSILLFEPGTTASNATSRSLGISANGQRPSSSSFLLDGVESNFYLVSGPLLAVAPEAVQEYRLSTNNFSAEYGGAAGYIANAVTRAGGTVWHGQTYFDLENEILNANGFQDNAQGFLRRPSKEDRAGFFAGGPVVRDRLFVGLSTEYFRTRDFEPPTQFNLPNTQLIQEACYNPASIACGLLKNYPAPAPLPATAMNFDPYITPVTFDIPVALNRWLGLARADYTSRNGALHGTFRAAVSHLEQPDFIWSPYPDYISPLTQPVVSLASSWTFAISPGVVNQLTAGFDDETVEFNRAHPNIPTLFAGIGNTLEPTLPGSLAAYGLNNRNRTFDLHDEHIIVRGRHIVKTGGGILLRHLDDLLSYASAGVYTFGDVTEFAFDQPDTFHTSLSRLTASYQQPNLQRVYREDQFFLFVEDTFRVSSRLTLNAGLRYDNFGGPVSIGAVHDPVVDLSGGVAAAQLVPATSSDPVYPGGNKSFAPRMGFSYDVLPRLGTLLRGGFGIFYDRIFDNLWLNARNNSFSFSGVGFSVNTTGNYNYLAPISAVLPTYNGQGIDTSFPNLTAFQKPMPNGYAEDFFLGVEQPGPRNVSFELNGAGSLGRRLITTDVLNYNQLENSNLPPINYISAQGLSDYYSLSFVTRWRGHHGFLQAAYTWSHAIDEQSDPIQGDFFNLLFVNLAGQPPVLPGAGFSTPGDSRGDRGNADFDQRQAFVIYGALSPVATVRPSVGRLINGWTLSTVAALRSGFPYTVYAVDNTPNLLNLRASAVNPGSPLLATPQPVPGGEQLFLPSAFCANYQDPTCTGAPTGRNAFEGPGLVSFDLSAARRFAVRQLGEGGGITLRADFFNVLNHANLNPPGNIPGNTNYGVALFGTPPANAGFPALVPLAETARRIQLVVRVTF